MSLCVGVGLALSLLIPNPASADPSPTPVSQSGLSDVEAMRQARASGKPVVATSLTDERTLVTADPKTGLFEAEVTAGVARVRDGADGWREPSTTLVRGSDGLLRPDAAVTQVTISPGGAVDAPVASISDGSAWLRFGWPQRLPTAVVEGSTATYPEVFPGVDLVAKAGLESVETFLVVKSRQASLDPRVRSWSMPMTTSEGLIVSLPSSGKIRFVPEPGYNPSSPLQRGPQNGYVDRFGNEWVVGPSRKPGHPFEWDVQLSPRGREQLGWLSRDGRHVNVSPFGEVTH